MWENAKLGFTVAHEELREVKEFVKRTGARRVYVSVDRAGRRHLSKFPATAAGRRAHVADLQRDLDSDRRRRLDQAERELGRRR